MAESKKTTAPAGKSDSAEESPEDIALRLMAENDELRARVAELETAQVQAALAAPARPRFLLSEGVRVDLEMHGEATDPATGDRLELNRDSGEVTVTDRKGGTVIVADVAALNVPRQR